ncbi:50S ribosomal protein L10 [bacterium]|nr:50S ribosomal protein L10 [bacterium]
MGVLHAKAPEVQTITEMVEGSTLVVFADFRGMSVGSTTQLRKALRGVGAQLRVVKNTLAFRALQQLDIDIAGHILEGPSALVYTNGDVVTVAKTLSKFKSGTEFFKLKGGVIERRFISDKQVDHLASLPSREELIAQALRAMKSPITGFVTVAAGPLRGFVTCVDGIRKQKESN